jgi:monoamine oxidase
MFTRRLILSSVFAPAVFRPLSAYAAESDLVVIGAGAAGLAAAKTAIKAGLSVKLLEARGRIGGRAYTVDGIDAGGAYIHFADKNPWVQIAKDLNIETESFTFNGSRFVSYENFKKTPDETLVEQRLAAVKVREAMDDYEGRDKPLSAFAKTDAEKHFIKSMGYFALGEEPERVSITDYNTLYGGGNLRVKGGYGALVAKYGADIPVELNTQVTRIDTTGKLIKITTNRGELSAKSLIITVPIGVLQAGDITFNPPLPRAHQTALTGMVMGALTKVIVKITEMNNPLQNFVRTNTKLGLLSLEQNNEHIIATMGGDFARELIKQGENAAIDYLTPFITHFFQCKITGGQLHGWAGDPHSKGSYAIVKPGAFKARELIREPITERAFLAGEATAGPASMTIGGATLEGFRVAETIIKLKIN